MNKFLIITGPQGSGNHMWSKIFSKHKDVKGWQELLDRYWVGHDQEPFADCWVDPELLRAFDWNQKYNYVTSISVPYMNNGQATVPDIARFMFVTRDLGIDCRLCVLGRDRNILTMQQKRVRNSTTFDKALDCYRSLQPDAFLSFELLQLYGIGYLEHVSRLLDFPICVDSSEIDSILAEDSNSKYFQPIEHHWVDDLARHTSRKWK